MNEPLIKLPIATLRKQRRGAFVRVVGWLLGLGILATAVAGAAGFWAYAAFTAPGPLKEAAIVQIPKDLGNRDIAVLLSSKGVVSDPMVMGLGSYMQSLRGAKLRAGEYEFPPGVSMAEAVNIMASGRFYMYKLTVPEGWTTDMALARLKEQEPMTGEISTVPPEGAVVANTYLYPRGTERQKLLDEMVAAQSKLVDEVWSRKPADSILKDKNELLTLASIVEKETAKPDERPRVAAVFINRLKAGMRLQSDPTIIYGITGGKGKLERPITQTDIEGDTPYNTYRINGLPPGPIASPGKDALEAVINPAPTSDLYFVADGTGGHVFAATLEEHNANVQKWRKIESGAEAPPAAAAGAAAADSSQATVANGAETIQPQLPDVNDAPAAADAAVAPSDTAVAAAVKTKDAMTKVPDPAASAGQPATQATGLEQVAGDAPPPEPSSEPPKPGTMVKVGKVLVPIPKLKPAP